MGRPKGSKNKPKIGAKVSRRGRPKGRKNNFKSLKDMGTTNRHKLSCAKCGTSVVAGGEAVSVVCASCVQKGLPLDNDMRKKLHLPIPETGKRKRGRPKGSKNKPKGLVVEPKVKRPRGRPRKNPDAPRPIRKHVGYGRGWHLKKHFVAPDGKKFKFGKEIKK